MIDSETIAWSCRIFILLTLGVIVRSDIKSFRIPNWASLLILIVGTLYAFFAPVGVGVLSPDLSGSAGLKNHLISFVVTLLFGFAFFSFRLWGAGDAKLTAALAIWLPYQDLLTFLLLVFASGGIVAIYRIVTRGNVRDVLINLQSMILFTGASQRFGIAQSADRIPFSIAIGMGWCGLMLLKFFA